MEFLVCKSCGVAAVEQRSYYRVCHSCDVITNQVVRVYPLGEHYCYDIMDENGVTVFESVNEFVDFEDALRNGKRRAVEMNLMKEDGMESQKEVTPFTMDQAFECAKDLMGDEALAGITKVEVVAVMETNNLHYVVGIYREGNESNVPDYTVSDDIDVDLFWEELNDEMWGPEMTAVEEARQADIMSRMHHEMEVAKRNLAKK